MPRALGFLGLSLVAACGGNSFRGSGGGSGGSSSAGTTSSTGGGPATGGSVSTGGTGGIDCSAVRCADPRCLDGQVVTRPGQCCPVCSCDNVACPGIACQGSAPILEPGRCCPICPPPPVPSCSGVACSAPMPCPVGYSWGRPPGACCDGCIADPPGPSCLEIACPDLICSPGYVPGDGTGAGCCYDCVPDPKYCVADSDCLLADRPQPCCGCPEAISTRMLAEDVCWSSLDQPRVIPPECYPQQICDVICGACPPPGVATCQQNRCTAVF